MNNPHLLNYSVESVASDLDLKEQDGNASGQMNGTKKPAKHTENTLEIKNLLKGTLEKWMNQQYQNTPYLLLDFLASLSRLQVKGRVLQKIVARYSLILPELQMLKDLNFYSWKTLKDSYKTTLEEPLPHMRNKKHSCYRFAPKIVADKQAELSK